jgi:hypothetical protein
MEIDALNDQNLNCTVSKLTKHSEPEFYANVNVEGEKSDVPSDNAVVYLFIINPLQFETVIAIDGKSPTELYDISSMLANQLSVLLFEADRDTRWTAALPGTRPSYAKLSGYSSIGSISRHLCLNLEQHLMFAYFAKTIMFTVGTANGIPEDDLPSGLRPCRNQKIPFLNESAGIPTFNPILALGN